MKKYSNSYKLLVFSAVFALSLAALSPRVSYAACDGTVGDDVINCTETSPGNLVLGAGSDSYEDTAAVAAGYIAGDGVDGFDAVGEDDTITVNGSATDIYGDSVYGIGGNDTITVNGTVFSVEGDDTSLAGGNDEIVVNGTVVNVVWGDNTGADGGDDKIEINGTVDSEVLGDRADNNGGNDEIIVNGSVGGDIVGDGTIGGNGGNDVIIINGTAEQNVVGDEVDKDGGDDTIVVNGTVMGDIYGDVLGDYAGGDGGDDTIVVNGTVTGDIHADDAPSGTGGNDSVTLGENASVGGTIDGEGGMDTLNLLMIYQDELDALSLNPSSDSYTHSNGETFTWINFENLIGKIREAVEDLVESGNEHAIRYITDSLLAVEDDDGIKVIGEHGLVGKVSWSALAELETGTTLNVRAANGHGWYLVVTALGASPDNPAKQLYLFSVFDAAGVLEVEFTLAN